MGVATRPSAIMKEPVEILGSSDEKRICVTQQLIVETLDLQEVPNIASKVMQQHQTWQHLMSTTPSQLGLKDSPRSKSEKNKKNLCVME